MLFKKRIVINDYIMNDFHSLSDINEVRDLVVCYTVIASNDKQTIIHAGQLIYEYLQSKSILELITIGERFKKFTSLDWSIDWKKVDIQAYRNFFLDNRFYVYLLILGTFHPNGYFRERCLNDLSYYKETLPFILLRLNDWVDVIQDISYRYALNRIITSSLNELLSSLYIIDKIQKSQRRNSDHLDKITTEVLNRIIEQIDLSFISIIQSFDLIFRKSIYKFILPLNIFTPKDYNMCLSYEKNSFCQLLIIKSILKNDKLNAEQLSYYLNHKSSYIRKEALYYKYKTIHNYWNGLEQFLLDSCFSIRDYTRFILRKHTHFDILEYYKNSFDNKNAIYGIGECGKQEDSKYILAYLDNDNSQYICATIYSLSHLLKDTGKDIYWTYLFHDDISVSKQAFLAIKHNKIKYGAMLIYDQYINNTKQHTKTYLFKLLLNEKAWDRLPYLLILYASHNQYNDIIIKAIENRNLYYVLSQEEADNIKDILIDEKYNIPQNIATSILFDLKFITK